MLKTGTYAPMIQGVSQQTPSLRGDGQLEEQVNMLSDAVTGLRRRAGFKHINVLENAGISNCSYHTVQLYGIYYLIMIGLDGRFQVYNIATGVRIVNNNTQYLYLRHTNSANIRTTVMQDTLYIMNTERSPTAVPQPTPTLDPRQIGWINVTSGGLDLIFDVTIQRGTETFYFKEQTKSDYPEYGGATMIANTLHNLMLANTAFMALYDVYKEGTVIGIKAKTGTTPINVTTGSGSSYIVASGVSNVSTRTQLPAQLPAELDGYIISVGTGRSIAYYQYDYTNRNWFEVGASEQRYKYTDIALKWTSSEPNTLVHLEVNGRLAGDEESNPLPEFLTFGVTGISSYQSRLVILAGSYVNLSRSGDPTNFMRTTVTELLDDDAIELSSTTLSNAQFEYAIPYNKDLVLFAQDQQAVIPNNSTVLTPKTAVIYPSTKVTVSLGVQPQVIGRTLYYTWQRANNYFQVGELLPSDYTDSQYSEQSVTDHLPEYFQGNCLYIAGSSSTSSVLFVSSVGNLYVNQFTWIGNERPQMAFHRWETAIPCVFATQVGTLIFAVFKDSSNKLYLTSLDMKNNRDLKDVPYLDFYTYVDTPLDEPVVTLPTHLRYMTGVDLNNITFTSDTGNSANNYFYPAGYRVGYTRAPSTPYIYNLSEYLAPSIAVGLPFGSYIAFTPPLLKDDKGGVVAYSTAKLKSIQVTTVNTGEYQYMNINRSRAVTYNGYKWDNFSTSIRYRGSNVVTNKVPIRTHLDEAVMFMCNTTTEFNITSVSYDLMIPDREVRRRR
jgi:hypothetical protein